MIQNASGLYSPTSALMKFDSGLVQKCLDACTRLRSATALDVGAYIGMWTIPLAERFDFVMAFEPIISTYECLVLNTKKYVNVTRRMEAVGDVTSRAVMNNSINGSHPFDWRLGPSAVAKTTTVDIVSIDSMLLKDVGFIKVNTNGSEFRVVRGARATIEKCRPLVLISEEYDPHRQASSFLRHLNMREMFVWERNFLFGW